MSEEPTPVSTADTTGDGDTSSKATRLPTFRGPRDLTLSRGQIPVKPRRTLSAKPNIPPKRDRSGTASAQSTRKDKPSPAIPSTSTKPSSTNKHEPVNIRDQQQRGRGRGRGSKRGELVQSQSIFAEGIGDPLAVKRSSASTSSGYGGGSSGSGGSRSSGGSSSTRKTIGTSQLSNFVKERGKELELGAKKPAPSIEDACVDSEGTLEESKYDPMTPVVVPLSSYVPERFSSPVTLQLISKTSADTFVKSETPTSVTMDRNSFAHLYVKAPKEGSIFFMQLPDKLPVLKSTDKDEETTSKSDTEHNTEKKLSDDISSFPEGYIGKIQILASGESRFVMGDNVFELEPGNPVGFLQELVSIDVENKSMSKLGTVPHKYICTPDIEGLLKLTI